MDYISHWQWESTARLFLKRRLTWFSNCCLPCAFASFNCVCEHSTQMCLLSLTINKPEVQLWEHQILQTGQCEDSPAFQILHCKWHLWYLYLHKSWESSTWGRVTVLARTSVLSALTGVEHGLRGTHAMASNATSGNIPPCLIAFLSWCTGCHIYIWLHSRNKLQPQSFTPRPSGAGL